MYLFFDTETTGLINFDLDLMHESQPRICQLAAALTDDKGNILDEMNAIIKPDGWTVPKQASDIHGLTTERCEAEGIPILEAPQLFNGLKVQCRARVAYNIDFDKRLLAREAQLAGLEHNSEGIESFCVMRMAQPICKMPPSEKMMASGRRGFKPPKLQEAFFHFFGEEMQNAHDAMADVRGCMRVFFAIQAQQRAA